MRSYPSFEYTRTMNSPFVAPSQNVVIGDQDCVNQSYDNLIAHLTANNFTEITPGTWTRPAHDGVAERTETVAIIWRATGDGSANQQKEIKKSLFWREIEEERYTYMLETLPPIYGKNGSFANGDPLRHNRKGEEVFYILRTLAGKFYESVGTVAQMNSADLNQEIIDRCAQIDATIKSILTNSMWTSINYLMVGNLPELYRHAKPILYHHEIDAWLYTNGNSTIRDAIERSNAANETMIIDLVTRHGLTHNEAETVELAFLNEQHPLNYAIGVPNGNVARIHLITAIKRQR